MKGFWLFAFCALFFGIHTNAYLYRDAKGDIKVLRKWNAQTNRYHYWIGFRDFHDKHHKHNGMQRKRIEELLPCHHPEQVLVLVEDLSSPNDQGKLGCGSYFINSRAGILAGLGSFCKKNHVPVQNVEYRYCRVVGLGPIINNIHADPHSFSSAKKLTLEHLTQEVEHAYTDLLLGSTSSEFKNYLISKTNEMQKQVEKFKHEAVAQKTVADYVKGQSSSANRLDLVKNMLTFDGILIGFKLADATIKAPDKEKIVAFAGGTHIDEAYDILQKVGGFEPISAEKGPSSPELAKAINTSGVIAQKPDPISVELIEHYLKN